MAVILVTGATGRVGANLTRALIEAGHRVHALQLPDDPKASKLKTLDCAVFEGDLRDGEALARAAAGCEAVFHTACMMGLPAGMTRGEYFDINVRGTLNVLEAARAAEVERFIYTSSDVVYPSAYAPLYWPVDEAHPRRSDKPYGMAKILCEDMVWTYHREQTVRATVLRPGGQIVAGEEFLRGWTVGTMVGLMKAAAQSRAGHMYLPGQRPWEALEALAEGPAQLVSIADAEGQPWIWSRCDVRDVVQGHLLALARPEAIGETFNIAPPMGHPLTEAVPLAAAATHQDYLEWRAPMRWVYWNSNVKARQLLDYRPEFDTRRMMEDAARAAAGADIGVIPA